MKYCEHNQKGLLMYSLYGRFRVYTCALDKRHNRDWGAGFNELCVAACTNHFRKQDGERGHSFPYKMIDYEDIPFNEEALRQIENDKAERKAKAQKMRNEALSLIKEADKLEGANP